MIVKYNDIDLRVSDLVELSREAVYDESGTDYLWTSVRLSVQAVYAPSPSAVYVTAGEYGTGRYPTTVADGPVNQTIPNSPVLTDVHLRQRLMQPRRPLFVGYHSVAGSIVAVPVGNNDVEALYWLPGGDVQNGPKPLECSVVSVHGQARTAMVRWTVEFAVNECTTGMTLSQAAAKAVLSNRWTATLSWDEQGLATRTFEGKAKFRTDVTEALSLKPDAWRLQLFPPPPANTKRTIPYVSASPDGTELAYAIVDTEQAVTYLDEPHDQYGERITSAERRNVAYLEVTTERQYVQTGDVAGAVRQIVSDVINAAWAKEATFRHSDSDSEE